MGRATVAQHGPRWVDVVKEKGGSGVGGRLTNTDGDPTAASFRSAQLAFVPVPVSLNLS